MKKFKFLIKDSLIRKLKSKGFIISTIITSTLILIISLLPGIISLFTSEPTISSYNLLLIEDISDDLDISKYFKDETNLYFDLNITNKNSNYQDDIDNFYINDNYDLIIYYVKGETNKLIDVKEVQLYSKVISDEIMILRNLISTTKFNLLNLDDYYLNITNFSDPSLAPGEDSNISEVVMGISSILFSVIFLFIIFSTQTLGAEILEEKSTKAIETIISSVKASTHFYAKIISSIIFTAIQLIIMLVSGLVGLLISSLIVKTKGSSIFDMLQLGDLGDVNFGLFIIFGIISILIGVLLYLILFALFASFANNNEEYQKAQSPLMIILLIVFYGSMFITSTNLLTLTKILTYIPFLTPFLLPMGILRGNILFLEASLIIIINIIFIILLTKVVVPTYKVSILDYSGDKIIRSLKRSFKARKDI